MQALAEPLVDVPDDVLREIGETVPVMFRWVDAHRELGCAWDHFRAERCARAPCACACHQGDTTETPPALEMGTEPASSAARARAGDEPWLHALGFPCWGPPTLCGAPGAPAERPSDITCPMCKLYLGSPRALEARAAKLEAETGPWVVVGLEVVGSETAPASPDAPSPSEEDTSIHASGFPGWGPPTLCGQPGKTPDVCGEITCPACNAILTGGCSALVARLEALEAEIGPPQKPQAGEPARRPRGDP
jgi:hypothetical protein